MFVDSNMVSSKNLKTMIVFSSRERALVTTTKAEDNTMRGLLPAKAPVMIKPKWHPPWKLYRSVLKHFYMILSTKQSYRASRFGNKAVKFSTELIDEIARLWPI